MNVFSYRTYKAYLHDRIAENEGIYGYKSQLAQAAGCQRSFLSQVLGSEVHLTPEHALGLAGLWKLTSLERDYFLDLVNLARAGSRELRELLETRLANLRKESADLSKRYRERQLVDTREAAEYYSSWHHGAAHMLLTIPKFQTLPALSARLGIPADATEEILASLTRLKLIQKKGARWTVTNNNIHIARESPLNQMNHGNWRARAVTSSLRRSDSTIHYTGVYSLSLADAQKLRTLLLETIDRSRKIVMPSPEEEVVCMTCDFFPV